jgi:hypothetical protein
MVSNISGMEKWSPRTKIMLIKNGYKGKKMECTK